MPEVPPPQGILGRGRQELDDLYEFHQQEHPGRFVRNHTDFLIAVTAGKVNRYVIMPLVGFQSLRDGIGDHLKETVMIGGMEVTFFVLFSAYFARIKSGDLLKIIGQEGITKTTGRIALGYGKGRILGYIYLYKLAMKFADEHPRAYYFMLKYSLITQNVLRPIL